MRAFAGALGFPYARQPVDLACCLHKLDLGLLTNLGLDFHRLMASLSDVSLRVFGTNKLESKQTPTKVGVEAMVMTDETVVDVLEVAEKVLVEVGERVKVRPHQPHERRTGRYR